MPGRIAALGALAAACCVPAGAATPIFSTVPAMYVTYSANCTFTLTTDGGITIDSPSAPGVQIPPGPYQLQIRTAPDGSLQPAACPAPSFQLTGPGVSYASTAVGGAGGPVQATQTFQAGATYVAVDANHLSLGEKVFTTAASGSSSSLLPPPPADAGAGGATQADLIGSAIMPFRGTLEATVVGGSARSTLVAGGKAVTTLRAGRYTVVAVDRSTTDGLFVRKQGRKPTTLSGIAFTGRRSVSVNVTVGTWTFYTDRGVVRTISVTR
jgi:hypothetical protein